MFAYFNSPPWKQKCPHFFVSIYLFDNPASKLSLAFCVIFWILATVVRWCFSITLFVWHEYRFTSDRPIFSAMKIDSLIMMINKYNSLFSVGFWFKSLSLLVEFIVLQWILISIIILIFDITRFITMIYIPFWTQNAACLLRDFVISEKKE